MKEGRRRLTNRAVIPKGVAMRNDLTSHTRSRSARPIHRSRKTRAEPRSRSYSPGTQRASTSATRLGRLLEVREARRARHPVLRTLHDLLSLAGGVVLPRRRVLVGFLFALNLEACQCGSVGACLQLARQRSSLWGPDTIGTDRIHDRGSTSKLHATATICDAQPLLRPAACPA
jgi:hypothetical protein